MKLIPPLLIALACLGTAGCVPAKQNKDQALKPQAARPKAKASAPKPTPHKAEIKSWALTPYTRDQYPKTFAKYGSRMAELEAYRRKAAEAAARNPKCKQVDGAEISSMKGSLNNMHFFVDCNMDTDMVRFRFTESELDRQVAAVSETDKAFTKEQAGELCKGLIRQSVNHPSTLGINGWDYGFKKFEPLGNTQVRMDFKAKNGFGLELKYTATCTFQPGNPNGEIKIKERGAN
nr:hypothetical protein 15 [bacterium]